MPVTGACTTDEKIPVTLNPLTPGGRPAGIQNLAVTVTLGDGTVNMTGPTSYEMVSADAPGTTEYLVEADADLGEGVVLLQDTATLVVGGAFAASLGQVAGAPIPK